MAYTGINLLTSNARVQVPWVKVTIGDYTFGIYNKKDTTYKDDAAKIYNIIQVEYPNYIESLSVTKLNGQVNKYTLRLNYPVTQNDDPNFFEKVFASVSNTRKIVFSYGDMSMPQYVYREEEAVITKVTTGFNLKSSTLSYTVNATSTSLLSLSSCSTYSYPKEEKPSKLIKDMFKNTSTGLQALFTGMSVNKLEEFIDGSDKAVEIEAKSNMSVLDQLNYLVSCMQPSSNTENNSINDGSVYVLTIHDNTTTDKTFATENYSGPYFKVKRVNKTLEKSDAYTLDVGTNTMPIITNFSITDDEGYMMYFDYQGKADGNNKYKRILNNKGEWEDLYAPTISSKNEAYYTTSADTVWWTKVTQYPIKASITILGLLRPAILTSYVRLNVIFPGGRKHNSSGLYIVTSQQDTINNLGYFTELGLTRISGSESQT